MVKVNKVTTKTGDDGSTSMFGAGRVRKDSVRMEAIGAVDEVIALLGMIVSLENLGLTPNAVITLKKIQNDLFDLGSELAASGNTQSPCPIKKTHISYLEKASHAYNKKLSALTSFVLPGGSILNSWMHLARVSTRKAERTVVKFSGENHINPLVQIYLNRLSDLLFILARAASYYEKTAEILWVPGKQ